MIGREWVRACDTSACVEVYHGDDSGLVFLRTTWDPDHTLTLLEEEWDEFVAAAKAGRFD